MVPLWNGVVRRDSRGSWRRTGYRDCDVGFATHVDFESRADDHHQRSRWHDRCDIFSVLVLAAIA